MTDLFGFKKPRANPRKLMHVADAGHLPGGAKGVRFNCGHCGHDTGWIEDTRTTSENKRGLPCPNCNEAQKMTARARSLASQLQQQRFPTTNELALQNALEDFLTVSDLIFTREVTLNPSDRIDFMIEGQIGIEAKTRYPRRQIYRQLERYCESGKLRALILVTGTSLGLPKQIHGVPLYLVSTGRGAL